MINEAIKKYYEDRLKKKQKKITAWYAMIEEAEKEYEELENEYNSKLEESTEEDMNADDTEHARAFEADILGGLK